MSRALPAPYHRTLLLCACVCVCVRVNYFGDFQRTNNFIFKFIFILTRWKHFEFAQKHFLPACGIGPRMFFSLNNNVFLLGEEACTL